MLRPRAPDSTRSPHHGRTSPGGCRDARHTRGRTMNSCFSVKPSNWHASIGRVPAVPARTGDTMNINFKAAVAASVAGLLTLAACDATSAGADKQADGATLNLVGFLDPRGRQQADHRQLEQDLRRQGREVPDVVRCIRRPEPSRRVGARRRLRALLPRGRHPATRRRRVGRRRLEHRADQRDRDPVGGRAGGLQGQPEEHCGMGRHRQAGRGNHHPEPGLFRVGTLEHPGRLGVM